MRVSDFRIVFAQALSDRRHILLDGTSGPVPALFRTIGHRLEEASRVEAVQTLLPRQIHFASVPRVHESWQAW